MSKDLGKELRKIRIDAGERLLDMADHLGMSVAFLSAIETGRKQPPMDFSTKLFKSYKLEPTLATRIVQLCARARDNFTLAASTPLQRDTAAELAMGFARLSDDELNRIRMIMGSKK